MGTIRVTQSIMLNRNLNSLNSQLKKLMSLQNELSTGLKVSTPSDDPLAARRAVSIRNSISKVQQYQTNMTSVAAQLEETTTSVQSVNNLLLRAQSLTIQASNGTYSQNQLDANASEINQVLESVLALANHQTNGDYIFAGTNTQSTPFVATRDSDGNITAVSYAGNTDDIQINIADGIKITVNENGQDAFMSTQDVFKTLIDIRDQLNAGDQTSLQNSGISNLAKSKEQLATSLARVGGIQNRLESSESDASDFEIQLKQTLSDNIDADYAETLLNFNMQSNAYQAALNATAKTIQPTLLDYVQ